MIIAWGRDRGEETDGDETERNRGERHTRKGWKETNRNRQRVTVREEETERRDGAEETEGKRQRRVA